MSESPSSPLPDESGPKEPSPHYFPLVAITAFFAGVFIFGPLFVRRGPNKPIIKWCIMMTAFCMWLLWTTIYIQQLNPILPPRIKNTTLAWIAHKFGNPVTLPSHDEP